MKRLIYILAALGILTGTAWAAQTTITQEGAFDYTVRTEVNANFTELYGASVNGTGATVIGTSVNPSATVYSTALTGNPLTQGFYKDLTVSTDIVSTALTTLIGSTAGKSIHVHDLKIMVSGTAATATALAIECSDGTLLASWPIADLVTLVPMGTGIHVSTQAAVTKGAGLGTGCPASTTLALSNVGGLITSTTHVYVQGVYSWQ